MVEKVNETGCYDYAGIIQDGVPQLRDVMFGRNDKIYSITVATPEMLVTIKKENEKFPDDGKRDENVYVMDDVSDMDEVCRRIRLEIPFAELEPFVREQDLTETPAPV